MRYFKTERGAPYNFTSWYEFEGDRAVRQIDIYEGGGVLLLEGSEHCTEAPLQDMDRDEEIRGEEFQSLWAELKTRPHGTRRTDSPFLKKAMLGKLDS